MNRKLIYEQHHPPKPVPSHVLAAELNATVRCLRYADQTHRKQSLEKLVERFGAEEQKVLLGR